MRVSIWLLWHRVTPSSSAKSWAAPVGASAPIFPASVDGGNICFKRWWISLMDSFRSSTDDHMLDCYDNFHWWIWLDHRLMIICLTAMTTFIDGFDWIIDWWSYAWLLWQLSLMDLIGSLIDSLTAMTTFTERLLNCHPCMRLPWRLCLHSSLSRST